MANNEEFADKVLSALKKSQKAVDLTAENNTEEEVVQQSDPGFEITPFAGSGAQEGDGALTGGNKDILIIPTYGGAAATSPSQINFYWKSPTTPDLTGFDLNVRSTIFNFAQTTGAGVTTPVLVFGGYDGTNNFLPSRNWNAAGSGTTAKIFLDPFRGDITLDYLELNAGSASTTRQGNLWYDSSADKLRFAISTSTTSGFSKTVAFTDDIPGSVNMFYNWTDSFSNTSIPDAAQDTFTLASGLGVTVFINTTNDTATFGAAVRALDNTITSTQYFIASPAVVASGTALSFLNEVSYVPNTRLFSITSGFISASIFSGTAITGSFVTANTLFSGNLSGNAVTATTFTGGTFIGSLTGSATTAQNINVATTTSGTYFPILSNTSSTTSGIAASVDAGLSYNAATDALITGIFSGNVTGSAVTGNFVTANTLFSGNLSGNAVTATTFTGGTFNGTFSGSATTAQNLNVATTTSGTYFPVLSNTSSTTSGIAASVDAGLSYNAATDVLITGIFSGNVTGSAVTGNFVTANTLFSGNLSGNAVTATWHVGSLVGTATSAQNINVATTTSGTYFPILSNTSSTTSGIAASVDAGLSYNAATDVLITGIFSGNVTGTAVTGNFVTANTLFSGNLSGNAVTATTFTGGTFNGTFSGSATTAQNLNVATTTSGTYFPVLSNTSSTTSGIAASVDAGLSYNAATDVLITGIFSGNVTGNAVTATWHVGTLVGTATTATNVNSASVGNTVTQHFVMLSPTQSGSGVAVSSAGTALSFQPSTNTLFTTALQASGVFVGSANNTINVTTGSLTLGSNSNGVIIPGNLTVQGSTITVDSTVSTLVDPIFVIGSAAGGTSPFADDGKDRGIEFRWSTGAGNATTGFFGFDRSTTRFTFIPNGTNVSEVFSGTAGIIEANLTGTAVTASTGSFTSLTGTLTGSVVGTATTAQNLNVATTTSGTYFPILSNTSSTTSGIAASVDAGLSYNAATDVLITGIFSGNVTGSAVTGNFVTANTLFSGNLSGNAVTATTFTGGTFNGTFNGSITGSATTAQNLNVATTTSGTYFPVLSNTSSTTSGIAASVDAGLSYNAATDVLITGIFSGNVTGSAVTGNFVTANTLFSGNLSGNAVTATTFTGGTFNGTLSGSATTAQNLNVATTTSGTYFPVLSNTSSTTSGIAASVDAGLSYNAATDVLITGIFSGNVTGSAVTGNFVTANTLFSGNLSGNAVTATTFTGGTFNGTLSGSATTAQNLNVATTTSGTYFPVLSNTSSTTSGIAASVDAGLSYNAATDVLITGIFSGNVTGSAVTGNFVTANTLFSGNLSGNAVTATTFTGGTFNGTLSGSATTAQNLNVATTTSGTYFPVLSNTSSTTSGIAASVDAGLSYNAATDVLITGIFSGNVTGSAVTGNFVTANTLFSGNLSGNAVTATWHVGSLVGTATSAQNINVATTTSGTYFPILSNTSNTTSGIAASVDAGLSYNAATDVLITGIFSGNVTGNAVTATNFTGGTFSGSLSGSATTAQNINVVDNGTLNTTQYLLFGAARTGSGVAVSSNVSLSYNPSTNVLTTGGLAVTSTTALSSGTYLSIKTNVSDDSSTTDFFIRGLTSADVSKFSVDANGNLRATTKSFDIEHPTLIGKRLVYGVLEGPEHGVYHRGTIEGKGVLQVILPDYWHKLVGEDYTIQLSTWGNYGVHIVEKTQDYFKLRLTGDPISRMFKNIKVDYIVHGSRLDAPLKVVQD